ncbi:MAG TPA: DUF4173 domain-containing protein [Gemmatimonadales bacterium]|nr:DUF4173 domain-containing protein [Gemmatimonadales bacterium]
MPKATRQPGVLLGLALGFGILGDLLFRAPGLGLNAALWIWGMTGAWIWARRGGPGGLPRGEQLLLGAALLVGFGFLARDAELLHLLDAAALVGLAILLPLAAQGEPRVWSPAGLVRGAGELVARGVAGLIPLALDVRRADAGRTARAARVASALLRGVVITIPVLVVFGGLLAAADPSFERFLARLVRWDLDRVASHAAGTLAGAWLSAGFLSGALPRVAPVPATASRPGAGGLGALEILVPLGSLDLLFAAFIAFQIPYLFGGHAFVLATGGLSLAEYARRGFFELVLASALVLPLLLALGARLAEEGPARLVYRVLAGIQVGLMLAIIGSALHRMLIYQREYGLSTDRFYATAFEVGLAATLLWFAATELRGRSRQFVPGALGAWAAWLVLLHLVNPERVVVEVNVRRAEQGRALDVAYLSRLSADAVPALVAKLDRLEPDARAALRSALVTRWHAEAPAPGASFRRDLRSWNRARARAAAAVGALAWSP